MMPAVYLPDESEDFPSLLNGYESAEQKLIHKALEFARKMHASQRRESGEPYYTHPLTVAKILIKMKLDAASVSAALLHDTLEDTAATKEELSQLFGEEVSQLVQGVTNITAVKQKNRTEQAAENIRNILLAMVDDVRVILIKLADKLHNVYTLSAKPPARRKKIAQEIYDIFAPLADQLGISWMKDELKDLSLKHLKPRAYARIKRMLESEKTEEYLKTIFDAATTLLSTHDIPTRIEARTKQIHSIYEKMKALDKSIESIHDIFGLRIITQTESECYQLLGLIHKHWPPLENRFKDYIALPKANRYQSLHTVVLGPSGKMLEIQIRTETIHQVAEHGIAAHWLYKQQRKQHHNDLSLMQKVRNLSFSRLAPVELLEEIQRETLKESIYVFTPKGDIISLPMGSTAIDFAYHIHTEIGHHAVATLVDGERVSLTQPLSNTQVVEIRSSRRAHPKLIWLRHVKTERARHSIRHWINHHPQKKHLLEEDNLENRTAWNQFARSHLWVKGQEHHTHEINFAKCCNPAIGDRIIGYLSKKNHIVIHKKHCKALSTIKNIHSRTVIVEWVQKIPLTQWTFKILSKRNEHLFSDIESIAHIWAAQLTKGILIESAGSHVEMEFTMVVEHIRLIEAITAKIKRIPSIIQIHSISQDNIDDSEQNC